MSLKVKNDIASELTINHTAGASTKTLESNEMVKSVGGAVTDLSGSSIKSQCTAWVSFNGITSAVIRDSHNIASVVRTAGGTYDITFATAMDNTNYAVCLMVGATTFDNNIALSTGQQSTANCTVYTMDVAGALKDWEFTSVQIFGGKA